MTITLIEAEKPRTPVVARVLTSPLAWHFLSIAVAAAVLVFLHRAQWFFYDEWAFLTIGGDDLLAPHVGHWSTAPTVLYDVLRGVFGIDAYLPFSITLIVIHLALAHLIYRIAVRATANGWIAAGFAAVFALLGAGSENILWAFQIGFIGGIAVGMWATLLATSERWSGWRLVAIIALSTAALTWSGTAIPLVVATTLVLAWRRGWRAGLLHAAIAGGIYLGWYLLFAAGSEGNPDTGGVGPGKILNAMPLYIGRMLTEGWQSIFPVAGLGVIVLVAAILWLFRSMSSPTRTVVLAPLVGLAVAAAAFMGMTAFSRSVIAPEAAGSSRYVYFLAAVLFPILAAALSSVARRTPTIVLALGLVTFLGLYNFGTLAATANAQAPLEDSTRRVISAALAIYEEQPSRVNLNTQPDPQWAPDLTMAELVELYEAGAISIGPYDEADRQRALVNIR